MRKGARKCRVFKQIPGTYSLKKSDEVEKYEKSFQNQVPRQMRLRTEKLLIAKVDAFYPDNRADLANCFKVLFDCLQSGNVIANDRQIRAIVAERFVDKADPRAEMTFAEYIPRNEPLLYPMSVAELIEWVRLFAPHQIQASLIPILEEKLGC